MEPGHRVAHFEIVGALGTGGMGVVYRARDLVLGRDVALKFVHPERSSPELRQRFLEEARIAATLAHPNIAAIHEAGEAGDLADGPALYVAQELVEGETLAARLRRGPVPFAEAVDLTLQLLDALAEAHRAGILHRDIKPSNLMIGPGGRLKVLDFGVAKRLVAPTDTTRLADAPARAAGARFTIAGTPGYMAPEQIRGIADLRTDIFAAGCVLHEMLVGDRLLHAAEVSALRSASPSASAAENLGADVPPGVSAVLARALAFDPADRFGDARSFAAALREAVSGGPALPRVSSRFSRVWLTLAAALAISAAGAGLWRWSQPALAFAERDLVLIGHVVNGTGDRTFDSALEGALETDLRQSRYVNIFDDGRLANVLKSMRLPPETRIDVATGREVCRLAGIRVLLIPSISGAGSTYQLEASLIEPVSGHEVDRVRLTVEGRDQVLRSGIDELTRRVRGRLGESLPSIQQTDPMLVEYATPSWDALRFAKLGGEALAAGDVQRAARAFEQALQHDPEFPAALASLGLLYIELLNKPDEGRRMLTAALKHSNPASEREHVMLRAMYRQFVSNEPGDALEDYRFVSSLYPDLFQPYNNSGRVLQALGRYEDAAAMFEKAHALDPRHTVPLWNLWELRLNRLGDPLGAERHVMLLTNLQPENGWIRSISAWTDVALRRYDKAEQGMREVLSRVPLHPYAFPNLGHLLLRRGANAEAIDVYRELLAKSRARTIDVSTSDAALFLGLALRAAGQEREAREVLDAEAAQLSAPQKGSGPQFVAQARLATLRAATGRRDEAETLAREVRAKHGRNAWVLYTLARTHALLGDRDAAADLLRRARAAGFDQPYFVLIDPSFRAIQDHPVVAEIAVPPKTG